MDTNTHSAAKPRPLPLLHRMEERIPRTSARLAPRNHREMPSLVSNKLHVRLLGKSRPSKKPGVLGLPLSPNGKSQDSDSHSFGAIRGLSLRAAARSLLLVGELVVALTR